jgi:hypothetical protein
MELAPDVPLGPTEPESITESITDPTICVTFDETVDGLAALLLSSTSPVMHDPRFKPHLDTLSALQREVWFCHWGMVVSLCVYQQLISHVDVSTRESITQALGSSLARLDSIDETLMRNLIEVQYKEHSLSFKADMANIRRELACTALHSTVVCYIRDIALRMHYARQFGADDTMDVLFPPDRVFVGRNFFLRFAAVSSSLLDILYDVTSLKGINIIS